MLYEVITILITTDEAFASRVRDEVEVQLRQLSRESIARKSIV